jgi:exodeoxyribonuclease VII large subunit
MQFSPEHPLSVSQLNYHLKDCIEFHFKSIYIKGEIGSIRIKGAMYFTLKDEQQSIDVVMWSSQSKYLDFKPKEGDEVEIKGRISTQKKKSYCQIFADRMRLTGEGAMQREFERIKARLQQEGLFNRKRPVPLLPKAIALVTSDDSSAKEDFYRIAKRSPGTKVYLINAAMQGDQAYKSITSALERAVQIPNVEVIALTRGGGAMEHLWTFNDERLARFLWNCPLPLVVGIGHEDNLLIAELVADHRGNTPTGVAHMVMPDLQNLKKGWAHQVQNLQHGFARLYQQYMYRIQELYTRVCQPPSLQGYRQGLEKNTYALEQAIQSLWQKKHYDYVTLNTELHRQAPQKRLGNAQSTCLHLSTQLQNIQPLTQFYHRLEQVIQTLEQSMQAYIQKQDQQFYSTLTQLEGLSPLAILSRGYSITTHQQHVIRSHHQVKPGDLIDIRLHTGSIQAQVIDAIEEKTKDRSKEISQEN